MKIVRRSRLTALLRDGMQKRLTLVTAPAGYGKTTAVGEWLSSISSSGWPVATISLDEYDNNLVRFWSYVVAALQIIHPPLQFNIHELWLHCKEENDCTLLDPLINEIADIPRQFSLILDDYQEIREPSIHRALSYLIDHLPPNCHLLLISRVIPPLPVSRLRARDQLVEINASDLCFTLEETRTFLSVVMNLEIAWDEVAKLSEITEGWITGLKLSALTLQGQHDARNLIASFSGGYRHVLDYLTDEVLNRQEEAVKDFLLKTSILSELSAPLCNAVLNRKDSQMMLDFLEQTGLFVIPLDNQHRWYRYHGLFADLLQMRFSQLEPDHLSDLNMAAFHWLNENGYPEKSVFHALAAGEIELAADTVERCALPAIIDTDFSTVFAWFRQLPEPIIQIRPRLGIYSALTNLILGVADDLEAQLQNVESILDSDQGKKISQEEKGRLHRYIATVRVTAACTRGDFSGGIASAYQVLENLLPEDNYFLGLIEHYLAYAYQAAGRLGEGAAAQELACQNALRSQFHKEFVLSKTENARFHRLRGHLFAAKDAYQQARNYALEHNLDLTVQLVALTGLADIQREWNHISEADALLAEPIKYFASINFIGLNGLYLVDACLGIARNRILHGDFDQAGVLLQNARHLAQIYHSVPDLLDEVNAANVQLLLARGDLSAAKSWVRRIERELQKFSKGKNAAQRIAVARVQLADGQPEAAIRGLTILFSEMEGGEQGERLFEVMLYLSLALWQAGSQPAACAMLDKVISAAEPEGRIRSFLDCGEAMRDLLAFRLQNLDEQAISDDQKRMVGYMIRLNNQYKNNPVPLEDKSQADLVLLPQLTEPLSERELQVLNLLAQGFSSGEVAQCLVISINTAKAHIKSIYQKMNVHNRKEAVELAYSLNLILANA